jgi:hypothetical protein
MPAAPVAPSLPPAAPTTNCSGATSPLQFRACLAAHTRPAPGAHPGVAKPKPPTQGPGYGVPPRQILPKLG